MARYIDAEKVEKWLHRDDWGTPDARWRPEEEFGKMIDSMPTEDVAPVKHGKWIDTGAYTNHYEHIYECSNCHNEVADDFIVKHTYCLHCGAMMDEGE